MGNEKVKQISKHVKKTGLAVGMLLMLFGNLCFFASVPLEVSALESSSYDKKAAENLQITPPDKPIKVGETAVFEVLSDAPLTTLHFQLPLQATIDQEQLYSELSAVALEATPGNWRLHSQQLQKKVELPVVFQAAGVYEIVIGEKSLMIEVSKKSESEENLAEKEESSQSEESDSPLLQGPAISPKEDIGEDSELLRNLSQLLTIYNEQGQIISGEAINILDSVRLGSIYNSAITGLPAGTFLPTTPIRLQNIGEYQEEPVDVLLRFSSSLRLMSNSLNGLDLLIDSAAADTVTVTIQAVYTGTEQLVPAPIVFGVRLHNAMTNMGIAQNQLLNMGLLLNQWHNFTYEGFGNQHVFTTPNSVHYGIKTNNNTTFTMNKLAGVQGIAGQFTLFDLAGLETIPLPRGTVHIHHIDTFGEKIAPSEEMTEVVGRRYQTQAKEILHYQPIKEPENASGITIEEDIEVTYVYRAIPVSPKDPLAPDQEAAPEGGGKLPEEQGLISIDFVSQFRFGQQKISAQDRRYFAQPQTIVTDPETKETDERPNYIQISDRREASPGWQLNVRQTHPFTNENGQELKGAALWLNNQELLSVNGDNPPGFAITARFDLRPGVSESLILANSSEGQGTWIYRFGNQETAGSSIELSVPASATPDATSYQTTIEWQLMATPGNESVEEE